MQQCSTWTKRWNCAAYVTDCDLWVLYIQDPSKTYKTSWFCPITKPFTAVKYVAYRNVQCHACLHAWHCAIISIESDVHNHDCFKSIATSGQEYYIGLDKICFFFLHVPILLFSYAQQLHLFCFLSSWHVYTFFAFYLYIILLCWDDKKSNS